jgi:hypothetical protein
MRNIEKGRIAPKRGNFKPSTRATKANVYGTQSYAGKAFVSYAEHDRETRDRLTWFGGGQAAHDARAVDYYVSKPGSRYR